MQSRGKTNDPSPRECSRALTARVNVEVNQAPDVFGDGFG